MPRRPQALEGVLGHPVVGLVLVPCECASGWPPEARNDSRRTALSH